MCVCVCVCVCACLCVCVCVCVSVCLSVCPAFTAYVLLTMGRILIKFYETVETLVQLIVFLYHKHWNSYDVIMTSFLFSKVIYKGSYSAKSQRKNSVQRETIMLRQTVTLATAILYVAVKGSSHRR